MHKQPWLLGLVLAIGSIAVAACNDDDATPITSVTAGNGGRANTAGGSSAGAGRAGSAPSGGGATHDSTGSAGESSDDAGAAGVAGSSDTGEGPHHAGASNGGTGGSSGAGGAGVSGSAGHAGAAAGSSGNGGNGGNGGVSGSAGNAGMAGSAGSAGGANTFTLQPTSLGSVIGTASGLSLYVFKADTAAVGQTPPVSACTGGCLGTWPLYYGTPVSVPAGLLASDFGSFDRGGGVLQSTYKGWPLYTYAGDSAPGNVNGEGIGAKWYTAKSPFVAPQ